MCAGGVARGQVIKPKTTPVRANPTSAQPKAQVPSSSAATGSKPAAEEVCRGAGGEWIAGTCRKERQACEDLGNRWDASARTCELACPEGTREQRGVCVVEAGPVQSASAPLASSSGPPGASLSVPPVTPPPTPSPVGVRNRSPLRIPAILGGGVLLGAAVVTGTLALARKARLNSACASKQCEPGAKDDYDSARLFGNISTGTAIVGAAVLAAGLFLLPSGQKREQATSKPVVWLTGGPRGGEVVGQVRF